MHRLASGAALHKNAIEPSIALSLLATSAFRLPLDTYVSILAMRAGHLDSY